MDAMNDLDTSLDSNDSSSISTQNLLIQHLKHVLILTIVRQEESREWMDELSGSGRSRAEEYHVPAWRRCRQSWSYLQSMVIFAIKRRMYGMARISCCRRIFFWKYDVDSKWLVVNVFIFCRMSSSGVVYNTVLLRYRLVLGSDFSTFPFREYSSFCFPKIYYVPTR